MELELTMIKKELVQIQKNGRSFLGIDGGRIRSKIWICGIEFGGELKDMEIYLSNCVKKSSVEGFDLKIPYRTDPGGYERSTYDRYLSLLYFHLFEKKFGKVDGVDEIDTILKNKLYNLDSEIFKLNLFPLAKKSTAWNRILEEQLNISKSNYYGNMFDSRKEFFQELLNKFKPELLICTSTKEYWNLFEETFVSKGKEVLFQWDNIQSGNSVHKILTYRIGSLTVLIIPFLGRSNLSSHADVRIMGKHIRENYLS